MISAEQNSNQHNCVTGTEPHAGLHSHTQAWAAPWRARVLTTFG